MLRRQNRVNVFFNCDSKAFSLCGLFARQLLNTQLTPTLETCGCNPPFSLKLQTVSVSKETPHLATLQHVC